MSKSAQAPGSSSSDILRYEMVALHWITSRVLMSHSLNRVLMSLLMFYAELVQTASPLLLLRSLRFLTKVR